jgi:23S rRNA (adenine2503-C2)-methyltransferase
MITEVAHFSNDSDLAPVTQVSEIRQLLGRLGAKLEHESYILRAWLRGQPLDTCPHSPENYYPTRLRKAMPSLTHNLQSLARVRSEHPSRDGSVRLLVELRDGQTVESVLLPRDGVCVSSQVGCAVGCVFCMTGRSGLVRQLGSAEIVAQVVLARVRRPLRKVVFMGMGEPSHNLSNVLDAIQILGTEGQFGHKQIVFSTVGDRRAFERLPLSLVKPALALSLHTTRSDLRAKLLPRAPRIDPDELVELAERYAQVSLYPVQYQWTLIEGINDSVDEIEGLVRLLKGKRAVLNLIPYNTVADLNFRRPEWDQTEAMAKKLNQRGILTKLRRSSGQDVDGGCGQLRARALELYPI